VLLQTDRVSALKARFRSFFFFGPMRGAESMGGGGGAETRIDIRQKKNRQ